MVNEVVFVSKSGAVLDLFLFVAVSWMPGISFWGFFVDLNDESFEPEELGSRRTTSSSGDGFANKPIIPSCS